jgi:pimeloyl-ACP methyl ester carboxylesterase
MMRNFLIGVLCFLAGFSLLVTAFVWIYAPLRAKRMVEKYVRFRMEYQSTYDSVDAQFNQQGRVVNGIQWHYVEEGNPKGTTILFLHGLPEGWYSWSKVLPLVDHDYRLIAIDMKGYGRSDKKDKDYNWHTVASKTLDLMTSLGVNKFYLVSHDWGSIIGSVLVSDYPDHILGYVRMEADLIQKKNTSMISAYIQKPQWLLFQSKFIASYMMQDPGWFIDMVYPKRMVTPLNQLDRDYLVYEFSRSGVSDMVPDYFLQKNWDLDTAIGKICRNNFPFPVLQLQADSDPDQPPSIFADVATECPNVQLEWVMNASHFDNFDQPTQVADAINRFTLLSTR